MLFHVGAHKTGTTTLQARVFPRYASVVSRVASPGYRAAATALISATDSEYRPDELRAIIDASSHATSVVVSDELLSGWLWSDPRDRDRTAARLHALAPDAHVLICVRNQRTWLQSFHSTYVKKGGYVSFSRLLEDRVPTRRAYFDHARWDTLVETYQRAFGPEQVTVLPYELLQHDPEDFLGRIIELLVPAGQIVPFDDPGARNRSPSRGWLDVLRFTNRWLRRTYDNPHPIYAVEPHWRIREIIDRADARLPLGGRGAISRGAERRLEQLVPRYAESNARLEALTGLSLRRYGYPLP
jgi:hypothetical protein